MSERNFLLTNVSSFPFKDIAHDDDDAFGGP